MIPFPTLSIASVLAGIFLSIGVAAEPMAPLLQQDSLRAPLPIQYQQQMTFLSIGKHIDWLDAGGRSLARLPLATELLDWRYPVAVQADGKLVDALIAATVFLPEQQPGLVLLDPSTGEFRELLRVPVPEFKIENICLSRAAGRQVSLYLLDERGTAEHWLVVDAEGKPHAKLLRRVPIAPNSKACAVDDDQDLLFIAEENVGIWALGASEESSPGRVAVDMQQPFGQLPESVESMAVLPQGLVVAMAETPQLLTYSTRNGRFSRLKLIELRNIHEPEVVKAAYLPNQKLLSLVVSDEKAGHHHLDLPWEIPANKSSSPLIHNVTADVQTQTMQRFGDAADDPAIWVNKKHPQKSRVIGTNKQQGLFVYDLQGKEVQHFNTGRLNNVDVRYGIAVGEKRLDIAVATNRDDNSLAIYTIDPRSGKLAFSGSVKTSLEEIYGFCLYQSPSHKTYAIPNGKSGEFQQIELTATFTAKKQLRWKGDLVRRFYVNSQPEGCVADDKNQRLFVGEEDVALWTLGAEPTAGNTPEVVLAAGEVLVPDVEGVGIYHGKQNAYLVVSSQGNNTFVVMDALPPFAVRGRVRIDMDAANNIDGVSETDGLEVSSANLGGRFSEGMLVVQDGHKVMPEAPQNFKYVSWKKIRAALQLE